LPYPFPPISIFTFPPLHFPDEILTSFLCSGQSNNTTNKVKSELKQGCLSENMADTMNKTAHNTQNGGAQFPVFRRFGMLTLFN
jgi:hypothetical protein